jgi:hypothetical protein
MNAVAKDVAQATPTGTDIALLPIPQRVAIVLRTEERTKELQTLAAAHKDITVITNKDGREQAHRAYMVLRTERVAIESAGDAARADARDYAKAVIKAQDELVGIISPEEVRLKALRDAWDTEEERKKQEAIDRERARVAAIDAQIEDMRRIPMTVANKSADAIAAAAGALLDRELDPVFFGERLELAETARADVIGALGTMLHERQAFEAEQARLVEERAAQEQRQREEEARLLAQRQADDKRRAEEDARLLEERKKLEAERAEQQRVAAEAQARLDADRRKQEEAQAEQQRRYDEQVRIETEAREAADRERREAQEAEERQRREAIEAEEQKIAAERVKLAQDRAYTATSRTFSAYLRDVLASTDIELARAAHRLVTESDVSEDFYGEGAVSLREQQGEVADGIANHIIHLQNAARAAAPPEPAPVAAAELTAPPSQEGGVSAAAAPEGFTEALIVELLERYPYPGDAELQNGVAMHFGLPQVAAEQWILQYSDNHQ